MQRRDANKQHAPRSYKAASTDQLEAINLWERWRLPARSRKKLTNSKVNSIKALCVLESQNIGRKFETSPSCTSIRILRDLLMPITSSDT
jgi:hypothetical protein